MHLRGPLALGAGSGDRHTRAPLSIDQRRKKINDRPNSTWRSEDCKRGGSDLSRRGQGKKQAHTRRTQPSQGETKVTKRTQGETKSGGHLRSPQLREGMALPG